MNNRWWLLTMATRWLWLFIRILNHIHACYIDYDYGWPTLHQATRSIVILDDSRWSMIYFFPLSGGGASYSRSSSTSLASSSGSAAAPPSSAPRLQGFIATLKETFGFIETAEHEKEVFFHFTMFDGEPTDLELGDEVSNFTSRWFFRSRICHSLRVSVFLSATEYHSDADY